MSDYSAREERLNTLTHGLGLALAIMGLVALTLKVSTPMLSIAGMIYGISMVVLFLASTCYHAVSRESIKRVLKLVDHSAIYLLIAGTYTPFLALMRESNWANWLLIFIWVIAIAGVLFKVIAKHKFPKVSLITYLVMGWIAVAMVYPIYLNVEPGGLMLLILGGILFSVGTLFYVAKHKQYTHAIWHLFVVGGCSCHYFSIYSYVV